MISLLSNRPVSGGHRAPTWSRRAAALTHAAVLAAAGLIVLSPAGADAATQQNLCGSSFGLVKTWPIRQAGIEVGGIDVYYSNSTGQNCIIVSPNARYPRGTFHHITAALSKSGSNRWEWDGPGKNYTQYAGPVYVYAKGSCINFYGEMRSTGAGADRLRSSGAGIGGGIGGGAIGGIGGGAGAIGGMSDAMKKFLKSKDRVSEYQTNRHCG
ncbi:hypothetical protein OHA77_29490 [Streptosporangium sp. NBC_01639]|uniref:hypothetical protein n=1 Tax=Streptosporangium sp. NBC_01639 TaxID=2975948 RepID=UPI00386E1B49|nr:hypothetical protein OHA77_29490 [Streptosporangium sp. NBC_01639]